MFLMIAALAWYFLEAVKILKAAGQGDTNKISPLSYIDNMFFEFPKCRASYRAWR